MHGLGSARSKAIHDHDPERAPLTPRGMAAPPPAPLARRAEGDPGRPATIRIEANFRGAALPARETAIERAGARPQVVIAAPSSGERLQGLVLVQGLLLNAFVLLLVFGWSAPLPGRSYLLGAFVIGGIAIAVLIHFALLGARTRGAGEARLSPAAPTALRAWLSRNAVRALPAALVTGWLALGMYALALPPTANAFQQRVNTNAASGTGKSAPAGVRSGATPATPRAGDRVS